MRDIRLRWDLGGMEGAIAFDAETNDLVTDDGLGTAVIISLFTDARARPDDVLPGNLTPNTFRDERGWWGDLTSEKEDDSVGSRLWLLERSKDVAEVATQAKRLAEEALQWMIDEGVAAEVSVTAEPVMIGGVLRTIGFAVKITRATGEKLTYLFQSAWQESDYAEVGAPPTSRT